MCESRFTVKRAAALLMNGTFPELLVLTMLIAGTITLFIC
jgi:hypothetical protein